MTSPSLTSQPASLAPARYSRNFVRFGLPLLLLLLTMLSTTAVGMRYMYNFRHGQPPLATDEDVLPFAWVVHNFHAAAEGLPFSLTLIGILLAHEFGHYFACRYFSVSSTLPWLLPAPSLSGTFGAVIRIHTRIATRAALLVIGAAGPIAGFLIALIALALGLSWSSYSLTPIVHTVQPPLALAAMHALLNLAVAPSRSLRLIVPHPVLIAAWMGLLITALNLVPAGQLDGGHILYAISPAVHRWTSRCVIAALFVLGILYWAGWIVWALILMLPGMRHPRVADTTPLTPALISLLPICALILLLCGTYQPFQGFDILTIVHKLRHL